MEPKGHVLHIDVKHPNALSATEILAWQQMRQANPALYSPYFHPHYTQAIGQLCDDAHVIIAYDAPKIPIGFLPYQGAGRDKGGFARPIGAPLTDYHGVITSADATFTATDMLRAAGIGVWQLSALVDHSAASPSQTMAYVTPVCACIMDLSSGTDAWRAARDPSYKRHLKSHRRRVRKSEDRFGSRRFEYRSMDEAVFKTLIDWKAQKFAQTGKYNVLSAGWTLALLQNLWQSQTQLRCDMHALYFGDSLAAIDLGLSDGPTFHSWIVAYNSAFHHYAPGIQLLEGLMDAADHLGYKRIDLGVGLDGYKRHYGSDNIEVSQGFIPIDGLSATLARLYGSAEKFGQKALHDAPGKLRRRYSQIAACDHTIHGRTKAMFDALKASGHRPHN